MYTYEIGYINTGEHMPEFSVVFRFTCHHLNIEDGLLHPIADVFGSPGAEVFNRDGISIGRGVAFKLEDGQIVRHIGSKEDCLDIRVNPQYSALSGR